MNPIKSVRRGHAACRRDGRFTVIAAAVAVAMLLAVMLPGCGSSAPATNGTPAPAPAAAAASIGPVWAQVDTAETPLFSLVVTESQGFSAAEQTYLRGLKITWNTIGHEATEYAALAGPGADPAASARLARRLGRQAAASASEPSPSTRFSVLHQSARLLMRRVVRLSRLTQSYASATSEEQKVAIATRITRLAAPLAAETLTVTDWGVELRNRYGGLGLAVAAWSAPATTSTTPTSSTSAPQPQPQPQPQPNPNPNPTSTPKPDTSITAAEARQIAALAELDTWLTGVLDDTSSTLEDQKMPWSEDLVVSFCLNMSFLQDACDQWLGRPAAGRRIAAAYKEYLTGLSLVRKGATRLNAAAQDNDTDAAKAGGAKLKRAAPYLRQGMARLEALR